jgi:hypothetical protein
LETGSGKSKRKNAKGSKRMPEDSTFYDKIIPLLLIGLAVFTVVIILAAAAILFGVLPV